MSRIIELSIDVSGWVGIGFFFLSLGSIFLVGGDGTAPAITHLMLKLGNVPIALFGLSKTYSLLVAPPFWGVVAGACTFILLHLVEALR
jgi:hypothetical protein